MRGLLVAKTTDLNFRGYQDEVELLAREQRQLTALTSSEALNLPSLAEFRTEQAAANINAMMVRAERAFHLGCYIETMSLFIQHMELWLRIYRAAKLGLRTVYGPNDKMTFGRLVEECAKLDFDVELIKLLRNFNLYRNRVVHAFVVGHTDYEFMRVISARYSPLPPRIGEFVRQTVGFPPASTT